MAAKKITDHDPLFVALIAASFVWIVFDSVALGIIVGLIGFVSVGKSQKQTKNESSNT